LGWGVRDWVRVRMRVRVRVRVRARARTNSLRHEGDY